MSSPSKKNPVLQQLFEQQVIFQKGILLLNQKNINKSSTGSNSKEKNINQFTLFRYQNTPKRHQFTLERYSILNTKIELSSDKILKLDQILQEYKKDSNLRKSKQIDRNILNYISKYINENIKVESSPSKIHLNEYLKNEQKTKIKLLISDGKTFTNILNSKYQQKHNQSLQQNLIEQQTQSSKQKQNEQIQLSQHKQQNQQQEQQIKQQQTEILNQQPQKLQEQLTQQQQPQPQSQQQPQTQPQKQIKLIFTKDQKRLDNVVQTVKLLVDKSSGQRAVDVKFRPYIRDEEDFTSLAQNYNLNLKSKKEIKEYIDHIRYVRGDGNCFYTAFGFQFLNILICEYSVDEYDNFIDQILKLKLKLIIHYINFQDYDDKTAELLLQEFLYMLQQLRQINDQNQRYEQLVDKYSKFDVENDGDGCLCVLSVIFLRNLSDTVLEFSELKAQVYDRETLLEWEKECNNNEIIISCLAQYLKITVQLFYFEDKTFVLRKYNEGQPKNINLLIKPGHYNIGLKKNQIQE